MLINQHTISQAKKDQGAVLVMVLLFSSLLAVIVLFSWSSALLQNKMAHNYAVEVLDLAKAEASLEEIQGELVYNRTLGTHLQFVPNAEMEGDLSGIDYYEIQSDPQLKVKLKATIAVHRDPNGLVQQVIRKTWEEMRG